MVGHHCPDIITIAKVARCLRLLWRALGLPSDDLPAREDDHGAAWPDQNDRPVVQSGSPHAGIMAQHQLMTANSVSTIARYAAYCGRTLSLNKIGTLRKYSIAFLANES